MAAVEPNIGKEHQVLSNNNIVLIDYLSSKDEADIIVVLVDHKEFIDNPITSNGRQVVIDTKGIAL